jgi:hypothetical protein
MTTQPRTYVVAVALAIAASAGVLLLTHDAHGSRTTALSLSVTGTAISNVDVPPLITSKTSPETPGDEVIAVSKIAGSAHGRRYLVCAATQTAPSIEQALYACQITYVLGGGTITAAGVARLAGRASAAITGGTGGYAGARGTLVSAPGVDTLSLG